MVDVVMPWVRAATASLQKVGEMMVNTVHTTGDIVVHAVGDVFLNRDIRPNHSPL